MATPSPIDIATPTRNPSSSPAQMPGRKLSTLTSALQNASPESSRVAASAMNIVNTNGIPYDSSGPANQRESFGGGMSASSLNWSGTRPISMDRPGKDKPRRESVTGSFMMGGMSWGGVSVGSWIREDVIMAGSSPFGFQSPSFHSSSYLPKMEANFMKDFACCGLVLPSLHDLLQHYEEFHAEQGSTRPIKMPGVDGQNNLTAVAPDNKAAIAAVTAAHVKQQADQQRLHNANGQGNVSGAASTSGASTAAISGIQLMRQQQNQNPQQVPVDHSSPASQTKTITQPSQDLEEVEDMEMDDVDEDYDEPTPPPTQIPQQSQVQQAGSSHFGRPVQRAHDPLGLNTSNLTAQMQTHQGLRNSQPPTPVGGNPHVMSYQHNPTVSSVNTPSLGNHPQQQVAPNNHVIHNQFSPDSSVPGTPSELSNDYSAELQAQMASQQFQQVQPAYGYDTFGGMPDMDMCIDDPAKRLYTPGGGFMSHQQMSRFPMNGAPPGYNPELLGRMQEQQAHQMMGNMGNNGLGMVAPEDVKPFRCPVIGCEKAYKNQNGLKYHKQHGHQTQKLFDNNDGTFSIVNPETSTPYPGTLGMEKEKPYRCEVCGKRYKNLNGLKYHKAHSPPCGQEAQNNQRINSDANATPMTGPIHGLPLGMTPNGLGGIGEESMA
ncbi:MAG: Transcriptional regulator of ribosomal biogenesis proteins [Vezdaea aestivalis]|nr:MAG: Transcriptional regulator of ribosomal biogenesis proteins [Vezdaea aestivalis]